MSNKNVKMYNGAINKFLSLGSQNKHIKDIITEKDIDNLLKNQDKNQKITINNLKDLPTILQPEKTKNLNKTEKPTNLQPEKETPINLQPEKETLTNLQSEKEINLNKELKKNKNNIINKTENRDSMESRNKILEKRINLLKKSLENSGNTKYIYKILSDQKKYKKELNSLNMILPLKLKKHLRPDIVQLHNKLCTELNQKSYTDIIFIEEYFKESLKKSKNNYYNLHYPINNKRGKNKKDEILKFIGKETIKALEKNNNTYLDIGANWGDITNEIKERFNFKQTYGADYKNSLENSYDIDFIRVNYNQEPAVKLPDINADFITCLMVLHHLNDNGQNILINDCYNKLNKGGFLLIKEHNITNKIQNFLIDLLHNFYMIILIKDKIEFQEVEEYFSNYLTNQKLNKLLKKAGFQQVKRNSSSNNPFYGFFSLWRK